MAIGIGSLIEISLVGALASGKWYNVFQYQYAEVVTAASAAQIAEAWWNHVKTAYRALYASGAGNIFTEVKIQELNEAAGEYATFAIPIGEKVGTRATPSPNTFTPSFLAQGVQLTVGTRLTRPGQKRLPIVYEADVEGDEVQSTWYNLVETWANVIDAPMVLGAPAATSVLQPIVCKKDSLGVVQEYQQVIGHLTAIYATSQNSRKRGKGF